MAFAAVGAAVETSAAASALVIRSMSREDLARLQELSPPSVKPVEEFAMYSTLVAEIAGTVVGYTQSYLSLDGMLHSRAIRVDAGYQGKGIARALMDEKERLARALGALAHYYAVDPVGEPNLKKLLTGLGFHRCLTRSTVWLYVKDLGDA